MLITFYLARRWYAYTVLISLLLAFIFNFIEFFEKLVRIQHIQVKTIAHFLVLNFMPALFDLLPVGVWLATCFLLRELVLREEWDLLKLVAFVPYKFAKFLLVMGMSIAAGAFCVYEYGGAQLAEQAIEFKAENIKQDSISVMASQWFDLGNNQLAYVHTLDLKTLQGTNILIFSMAPDFSIDRIMQAPVFRVDEKRDLFILPHGVLIDARTQKTITFENKKVTSTSFFSQMRMSFGAPSLYRMAQNALFYRNMLPERVYSDFLCKIFRRIIYYLQIALYPLVTFCLFMLTVHPLIRWVSALSAYPLMIAAEMVSLGSYSIGLPPLAMLLPQALIACLITWVIFRWG